jgi:hypothetical protein
MITSVTQPLGYLLAGPLADRVFGPLLAVGGPLSKTVGSILGVGPGRGIGLLFVVMGSLAVAVTAAGYLCRPLRRLEYDLPDAFRQEVSEQLEVKKLPGALPALVPADDPKKYDAQYGSPIGAAPGRGE